MSPSRLSRLIPVACGVLLIGAAAPVAASAAGGEPLFRILWLSALMVVTLVLRAFYAGSETALVSLNKTRIARLAEEGDKRAEIIRGLVGSPERMLGMTLIGTNLMSVVISQINLLLVWAIFERSHDTELLFAERLHLDATMLATVVTTVLVLIFGEILAKTIFRVRASQLALRYARLLQASDYVLWIGTRFVTVVTTLFVKLMTKEAPPISPEEARSELRLLAEMGEESGNIMTDQRRMIHSVLNLYRRNVGHLMRPLVDIVATEEETDCDRFLQIASEAGHSRIPVYNGRIYNIVGVVNLLDVVYSGQDESTIQPFIRRDVLFVPESKPTRELLTEIQRSHHTMAFVVDEYGGVVGLVTVEDLVEEIVGDVSDERDPADQVRVIGPRTLECDGRAEVDELVERFDLPIPLGEYETISGYVLHRLRVIPKVGDRIDLGDHFTITVSQADTRGIQRLRIQSKNGDFVLPVPPSR
jgi:magnesium and cobalt exporter, CNNM family